MSILGYSEDKFLILFSAETIRVRTTTIEHRICQAEVKI
ncbi:hypothetical protein DSBG_4278 [Desulfosporosinus sp. BG]|nr:hypothetical protein DSBG_4278 [Desulfosporosinus sp. BG]